MFVADTVSQTEQHTKSGTSSTYAYYFTEPLKDENRLWPKPSWMRSMAGHLDDLKYLFGAPLLANETSTFWQEQVNASPSLKKTFAGSEESDVKLSYAMMLMWSNFAKSGNPNYPVALPEGTPTWPEFTADTNQFLELNSKHIKVITTPNKERLAKLRNVLWKDRDRQMDLSNSLEVRTGTSETGNL
ncbi:GTF3C5 [Bugula neritina]|uniref:GTF3C5 n=1 Tax=Bugula neritina TaxID=10212 RepID=A0A7J7ISZ4_BUGNE|nr:GTF3C5 [Bugula neritina]